MAQDHEKPDNRTGVRSIAFSRPLIVGVVLTGLLGVVLLAGIWVRRTSSIKQTAAEAAGIVPDHDDAGQSPHPHLVLPEISYDFGTLGHDQKVEHVFALYNTGTADLTVSDLEASCECTTPSIGAEKVPPGGMTELTVVFDPAAHNDPEEGGHADVGDIFRRVTITSNDPDYPTQFVEIYANVLEQ